MSSDNLAIRVSNLGKCYQIYDRPQDRLKQSVVPRLRRLVGLPAPNYFRDFWALRDVSCEIARGETVGIIGRNGSGKSTLLQLICGTLTPTTGSVDSRGRVAAMLELGAGFNPEFTGRENVYLNAALLGLSTGQIDARYEDIVAFAEIGEFIEQPVKTYSSGMFARLAFAVSIHVEPEILVVDEALAVGDFGFQLKCFRKLRELSQSGCTVLLVTHDIEQVQKLCNRALYLKRGRTVAVGDVKNVCERYLGDVREAAVATLPDSPTAQGSAPHAAAADYRAFAAKVASGRRGDRLQGEILHVSLADSTADEQPIGFGASMEIRVVFRLRAGVRSPILSVYVVDKSGQLIVGTSSANQRVDLTACAPGAEYALRFAFENRLREGEFALQVFLADVPHETETEYIDYMEMALSFRSLPAPDARHWALYNPAFTTSLERIGQAPA